MKQETGLFCPLWTTIHQASLTSLEGVAVSRVAKLSVVSATKQPCNARLFVPVTVAVIVKVTAIRSLPFCGYVYLSTKSKIVSEA